MPQLINLEAVPNQELDFQADDTRYVLTIRSVQDFTTVDISVDGIYVIEAVRVMIGTLLMPYDYMESDGGNFLMLSDNEQIPFYTNFGITQRLIYLSAAELDDLRGN